MNPQLGVKKLSVFGVLLLSQILSAQYRYPPVGGDRNRTEVYLIPAPTASPMSPSWSPDGRWIAFSMWGSIWRVSADGGQAEELTAGPGYDYQPSYAPDGERIVFVRDQDAQLDLWEYAGDERQLTNDQDVDLLPSYGPSGEIVFYSARAGQFDVWKYPLERFTHATARDIQPTRSPTSPLIAFVSTRESPLGTGGIWTRNLDTGESKLVHWEETVYRARPSFSPDGTELLFSSRGDLWRIPVDGGAPIQVTRGPAQDIEGRWSPDGREVVYVSDSRELRIVSRDGGASRPVRIDGYRFKRSTGVLKVELDGPARVSILAADGRGYTPPGRWHHVASATETHFFYTPGSFEVELPRGEARLRVSRGFEHAVFEQTVEVPGSVKINLAKRFDLPGWYSGDTHVHDLHSGIYPLTTADMALAAAAEDLNVANMLVHVDGTRLQGRLEDLTGEDHPLSTAQHILRYSEEYRSSLGHLALLGVSRMLYPISSAIRGTSLALPWPPLFLMAERARRAGAVVGIPHPYYPEMVAGSSEGIREGKRATEIPVDVALGTMDYYDISCIWSEDKLATEIYYRLLNSGFKLPVAGGTDSFSDVPRNPPLGTSRTYVRLDDPLTFDKWIAGLKAGRSLATNGPLLTLRVQDHEIGDEIRLDAPSTLRVETRVMSNAPVDKLELVVNGKVVETSASGSIGLDLPVTTTSWIAVRAIGPAHPLVGDSYSFAHTSPVYVQVANTQMGDNDVRRFFVRYIRELKEYIRSLPWRDPARLEAYLDAYDKAIEAFSPSQASRKGG